MTSTLDQLRVGARARVEQISGDKRYRLRLLEMGLTPGTEVRIVRVAPLGDPLTIDLRGSRISLRRADAAAVRVRSTSCSSRCSRGRATWRARRSWWTG